MVTTENYEEYLMMYADGELDVAAIEALVAFLAAHPELGEQPEAWLGLRLEANAAIVFEAKEALLKAPKRIVALPRPRLWAAAAAVVIGMVMISVLWQNRPNEPIAWKAPIPELKVAVVTPALPSKADTAERRMSDHKILPGLSAADQHSDAQMLARETIAVPTAVASRSFEILPVAAPQIQPVSLALANETPAGAVPGPDQGSAFPAIYIAEVNRPALNILKQGLDVRISQITHAANTIRETAFAVRIGNKNHYLNF